MKQLVPVTFFLACLFIINPLSAQDATRFQNEVDAILERNFPFDSTKETVVFTGSSSIRMWNEIEDEFPLVNAINSGFGGSQFSDLIHYQEELIYSFNPDKILIYEGDNDIAEGKSPQSILEDAKQLLIDIRKKLPKAEVYFISPKPSIARWQLKEEYVSLNSLLESFVEEKQNTYFIDVWNPMLNEQGEPFEGIFIQDNLHMNSKGYEIWRRVISRGAGILSRTQIVNSYAWWNRQRNDWAFLSRFEEENKMIDSPSPNEKRVVFMGNSITQGWPDASPEFFEGKPYIERGISGQTTPQMLVRFRSDVVDLDPKVVVILAGTNDLAENTGPATNKMIQDNIAGMAEIASANGIKVILSSIMPVYDYPWRSGLNPSQRIIDINAWMKNYCEENGHIYLDYWSAMVDDRNGMDSTYTYDGVHANKAGYTLMESLVEKALEKAFSE